MIPKPDPVEAGIDCKYYMDLLRVLTKRDPSPAAAAGGEDADPPEAPSPQNRLLKLSQESGVGVCRVVVSFFVLGCVRAAVGLAVGLVELEVTNDRPPP